MEKNENTLISGKQKKAVRVVEKLLTAMHHDIKELNKIEDIEVVLTNKEGCAQYDLPTDRMGDIICMSSKNMTIGSAESAHDLSKLKEI